MKEFKQNAAITLIALIVTIIILLILAGITIAQLTGNGLFEKAKLAKEKQENAQIEENKILDEYVNEIDVATTFGTRNVNENNYSTEEQVIGTWIDGKPIYRKVISFTTVDGYKKAGTLTNFEWLINAYASGKDSNSNAAKFPHYTGSSYYTNFYINPAGEIYWYSTSHFSNVATTLIVEYTKTTD